MIVLYILGAIIYLAGFITIGLTFILAYSVKVAMGEIPKKSKTALNILTLFFWPVFYPVLFIRDWLRVRKFN